MGVAKIVEPQIRHSDLIREITPRLAVVFLRGQGAVDADEQQSLIRQLAAAQSDAQFQLSLAEIPQHFHQLIGQGDIAPAGLRFRL